MKSTARIYRNRCLGQEWDGRNDPQRSLINQIVRIAPNVLGLSTCDEYLSTVLKFIKDLRAAGCAAHITLGGLCASAIPDIILNGVGEVNLSVVGEGEASIVDLARKVIRGEARDNIPGIWLREMGVLIEGKPRRLYERS